MAAADRVIILKLSEDEAESLQALTFKVRWEGKYGDAVESVHDALISVGVNSDDVDIEWDDMDDELVFQ